MKQVVVIVMVLLFANANAQSYQLQKEGNSIFILQNDVKVVVSNNTDAASAMDYQQKIYFVSKDGDGAIMAYDVNTNPILKGVKFISPQKICTAVMCNI
jgi:uncharacterized protein YxeA